MSKETASNTETFPVCGSEKNLSASAAGKNKNKNTKVKLFFSKILAGFVVGAGAIIPGLSGGILAVSMGLYQPTIEAVLGFFKAPKKNFKFLFPLGLGGVAGFALFMFIIDLLLDDYQTAIVCLFMGLVIGSVPTFLKEANDGKPFKKTNILYTCMGFAFAFALVLLGFFTKAAETGREITPLLAVICGGIVVLGVVMPGISTSFILMNLGAYDNFMHVFAHFFSNPLYNLMLAGCAVLGMLAVVIPMLFVVRKVLNKFHCQSYYTLFGILIATIVGCIMLQARANVTGISFFEVIIYIALFACGGVASYFMDKAMKKLEIKEKAGEPSASE